MSFTFIRNISFTRLLKTDERVREFNFRMIPNTSNSLFHVDVPDDRGNRIQFRMQRQDNSPWRLVDQHLPSWIMENEQKLNVLIDEELG
jgi:hypothetical protein